MEKGSEITTIKVTKKTVQLINELKLHPRQASEEIIRELAEEKLKEKRLGKKARSNIEFFAYSTLIILIGFFLLRTGLTGFVTITSVHSYNDTIGFNVSMNENHVWMPLIPGNISSVKISGSMLSGTKAIIYLEDRGKKYLLFNSSMLKEDSIKITGGITGMVVLNDELNASNNATLEISQNNSVNDTLNITTVNITLLNLTTANDTSDTPDNITVNESQDSLPVNESINAENITISLKYKSGSSYDTDDNGIESLNSIVDLTVEDTLYNVDINRSSLCTIWEIFNIEESSAVDICHGGNNCCGFLGLLPRRDAFDETYYAIYGNDGAGKENILSARVFSVDYALSVENPYQRVYASEWRNLSVQFREPKKAYLNNECIDTCTLRLDSNSYNLIFEVSNGTVFADTITYTVIKQGANSKPLLSKNFTDIIIQKNANISIELWNYFTDAEGDAMSYKAYIPDNLSVVIDGSLAHIVPERGFTGIRYLYFTANDSLEIAVSNVFMVNITETSAGISLMQGIAEINKPVKWKKSLKLESLSSNVSIELPWDAYNLSLHKDVGGLEEDIPENKVRVIVNRTEKSLAEYELEKITEQLKKSGKSEKEETKSPSSIQAEDKEDKEAKDKSKKDKDEKAEEPSEEVIINDTSQEIGNATIIVNDSLSEIIVEYQTPPPDAIESVIDYANKQVIISSDIYYESILAYTQISDAPKDSIRLYWYVNEIDYNAYISSENFTVGETFRRVEVTHTPIFNVSYIDNNNNSLIDRLEWIVPHTSNQTFEISITVLNVQSYPTVGGNWTVRFNTTGAGNLTIMAINGTTYTEIPDDVSTTNDLEYLETICNDVILNTTIVCNNDTQMPYEVYKIKRRIEEIEKRLAKLNETG